MPQMFLPNCVSLFFFITVQHNNSNTVLDIVVNMPTYLTSNSSAVHTMIHVFD